jgi:hypothetical protein
MQQPTNDNPSRTFQTLQSSTAASTHHQQYLCEEAEYFNPEFDAYLQKVLWEDDDFVRAVDAIGDSSDLTLPTPMDNAVLPSENQSTLISPTPTSPASTSPTSGTGEFDCHYHNHICFRTRECLQPSNICCYLILLQKNFTQTGTAK